MGLQCVIGVDDVMMVVVEGGNEKTHDCSFVWMWLHGVIRLLISHTGNKTMWSSG